MGLANVVYLCNYDKIEAVDVLTGLTRWTWKSPVSGYSTGFRAHLHHETIVCAVGKKLFGIDTADGRQLWERPFPEKPLRFFLLAHPNQTLLV